MTRLNFSEHDIAIGDCQGPAAPVAGRTWVGAGGIGAHPVALPIEMQYRASTCGYGVDRHHRRAHADAGDLRLEFALQFPGVVRHVGRRTAHIKANDFVEAGYASRAHHADNAACWPRQD